MAVSIIVDGVNASSCKRFLIGFLHPGLHGAYVYIVGIAAIIFVFCLHGYGSCSRIGATYLVAIPVLILSLASIIALTYYLTRLWNRFQRVTSKLESASIDGLLLIRVCFVAGVLFSVALLSGGKLREATAREVCRDAELIIEELDRRMEIDGSYPTNLTGLAAAKTLQQSHSLYYGTRSDEVVDWNPFDLGKCQRLRLCDR